MDAEKSQAEEKPSLALSLFCLGVVFVISYFSYMRNYDYPRHYVWDEKYNLPRAQRYLDSVFFMSPHPPLGPLLMALGEKLIGADKSGHTFLGVDRVENAKVPPGFSYRGYRLIPTLLAWLTSGVLFLVFLRITKNPIASLSLSFPYIFDNALLVHDRAAMMEGPLLFFSSIAILSFLIIYESGNRRSLSWPSVIAFGLALGFASTLKVNSLVLLLLVPAACISFWPNIGRILKLLISVPLSFAAANVLVWGIHFSLGRTLNTALRGNGYYASSEGYKALLERGENFSLQYFPLMLRDSIRYFMLAHTRVRPTNLCEKKDNSSPFWYWPLGARSIPYRWEKQKNGKTKYLYLQANPVVWWTALGAVLLAFALLISNTFFGPRSELEHRFLLGTFSGLWLSYLVAISLVRRKLYLYHYFLPLIFAFVILALLGSELKKVGCLPLTKNRKLGACVFLAALTYAAFLFYSPLTYYEPLSDKEVSERAILDLWDLRCARCPRTSRMTRPVGRRRRRRTKKTSRKSKTSVGETPKKKASGEPNLQIA